MGCNCNKGFSSDFMLLKPEEVSVVDLIRVLFSHDLKKRKFVDCPEGTSEESFKRRWVIFVSILVQKCLSTVGRPLAWFGSKVEQWLNLVSSNQNVGLLLWNFLRGLIIIGQARISDGLNRVRNERVAYGPGLRNDTNWASSDG
ncbi:hypothetical protein RJ639_038860 [Escallonia herrerae]|uniref:Uncharacterized protein n=1 Tax=Escallonia herrerae TaxID=1293975 RepID=A0AA88WLL0_9ASTE|nr:hypothetical protein RJ639_038860 [Escallonia herrerae]